MVDLQLSEVRRGRGRGGINPNVVKMSDYLIHVAASAEKKSPTSAKFTFIAAQVSQLHFRSFSPTHESQRDAEKRLSSST